MRTRDDIPAAVGEMAARLAEARPMRRGAVSERYMKCGQMTCRCQQDPKGRHGPYFSLTRAEGGRTQSRYLDASQAAMARRQIEAGQQFRKQVETYRQACERWADAEMEGAAVDEAAKKGGSRRSSTRKSSPRSRRS